MKVLNLNHASQDRIAFVLLLANIATIALFFLIHMMTPDKHLAQLIFSTIALMANIIHFSMSKSKKDYSFLMISLFALTTLYLFVTEFGIF